MFYFEKSTGFSMSFPCLISASAVRGICLLGEAEQRPAADGV